LESFRKEVVRIMKKSKNEQRWLIWITALVLTTFFAGAGPALADRPGVGSPAPDFTLNDIYGTPHTLSDYLGTIVVLAFLSHT